MGEAASAASLRNLVDAIVSNNGTRFADLLTESPELATACFTQGATRQEAAAWFVEEIRRYLYDGDTALHLAAAAFRREMAGKLIAAGAGVRAKNRRGAEPLHSAAVGSPGSSGWDPAAQVATIVTLIEAGADPNARNMDGATPLHVAVRTRCAEAVRALLERGADAAMRNKSGSTPMQLALHNTGRSGSGSVEAKAQRQEILRLLRGSG